MIKLSGNIRQDFEKVTVENVKQKDRILGYQEEIKSLQSSYKKLGKLYTSQKTDYENTIAEKDAIIKELTNKVAHLSAVIDHDGTNTGTPTSATPVNKKKTIPNSRRGSNKKKGGQPGHERHTMESFEDSDITDTVSHGLDISAEECDFCGGNLIDTGEIVSKDEFDVEINVIKRRHEYHICKCVDCEATVRLQIKKQLKEKNQYGSNVQALSLSLMATGNVAINKVRILINGMTSGLMNPSEGFISKLYKRASDSLGTV